MTHKHLHLLVPSASETVNDSNSEEEAMKEQSLLPQVASLKPYAVSNSKVVNFPKVYTPVRLAEMTDIKSIVELWANSATMRYFVDPVRWNWKGKASEAWYDYAVDLIEDDNRFLLICDMKDNGLSGFLIARLEELPSYYQAQYSLTVEEFYLRPKDKKVESFKEMLEVLLKEAYSKCKMLMSSRGISLRIEIVESDDSLSKFLMEAGFKKSSVTYTASIG